MQLCSSQARESILSASAVHAAAMLNLPCVKWARALGWAVFFEEDIFAVFGSGKLKRDGLNQGAWGAMYREIYTNMHKVGARVDGCA